MNDGSVGFLWHTDWVELFLAAIVMSTRLPGWLEKCMSRWDAEHRSQFEEYINGERMRWQRAHAAYAMGFFAFLIRSIFLPLDIYHTYVYQRLLMICGFIAWLIVRNRVESDTDPVAIHFRVAVDIYIMVWSIVIFICYGLAFAFAVPVGAARPVETIMIEALTGIVVLLRLYEIVGVTISASRQR